MFERITSYNKCSKASLPTINVRKLYFRFFLAYVSEDFKTKKKIEEIFFPTIKRKEVFFPTIDVRNPHFLVVQDGLKAKVPQVTRSSPNACTSVT